MKMYLVRWYPLEVIDESEEIYPASDGCDWVNSIEFINPKVKNWDFEKADMPWVKKMISDNNWPSIYKRHNDENWSNERYCCISQQSKVLKNVEIWESEQRRLEPSNKIIRGKQSISTKKNT
jgi:hypothetical protein